MLDIDIGSGEYILGPVRCDESRSSIQAGPGGRQGRKQALMVR